LCASHVESCANSTIFDALKTAELLESSELLRASLFEEPGFETASLLENSVANDPVATGTGLFTASSLHAVKDKIEIDASIASTEA
jgi:hypothetical protein